jgi:hypothetical protein
MRRITFVLSVLFVFCLVPAALAQNGPLPPSADLSLQKVVLTPTPINYFGVRGDTAFDDFNRADSDNMGPDWTEVVGDIDILNNEAYEGSGGNSLMVHTSGEDDYDTTMIEFDLDPNASGDSRYGAAIIGYNAGNGEDILVKLQNQTTGAGYSHYAFYHAMSGGFNGWGGFYTLSTKINGGHIIVYVDNAGDRVNLDIDEYPPDGTVDYHFEAPGLIASGLPPLLGKGTGAAMWSNGTMDNWSLNGGGAGFTLSISPDPLIGGQAGAFVVTNGAPNTDTYLAYSLAGPGSTYVPFLQVTLGLAAPKKGAGPTMTDGSGGLTWKLNVPNINPRKIWLQAAQKGQVTNVVATSIQ